MHGNMHRKNLKYAKKNVKIYKKKIPIKYLGYTYYAVLLLLFLLTFYYYLIFIYISLIVMVFTKCGWKLDQQK